MQTTAAPEASPSRAMPAGAEAAQADDDEATDRGTEHDADEDVQPEIGAVGHAVAEVAHRGRTGGEDGEDDDGDPDDDDRAAPGGRAGIPPPCTGADIAHVDGVVDG